MVELLLLIKLSPKDQVEMMMIVTVNVVVTHVIAIVGEIMEVVEGLMVGNALSVVNLVILQGNVLVKEEREGEGMVAGKVDIAVAMVLIGIQIALLVGVTGMVVVVTGTVVVVIGMVVATGMVVDVTGIVIVLDRMSVVDLEAFVDTFSFIEFSNWRVAVTASIFSFDDNVLEFFLWMYDTNVLMCNIRNIYQTLMFITANR
jgi:hypothetical protein